ncbi:hypothetical protein BDF20DRAFT_913864 [Mycotypha africana]|uniref:uncharacterized protein n=1 Tax=Mycotypha africana TaxID=64632 RepID=UPI0022FFE243|nr:uncharacterized protein BDF20DRAFT_913864 [Mycotypha africana]KAI8977554.1 hypothetical protein BDF20DRAFT_913864 [Mycotypha africana]
MIKLYCLYLLLLISIVSLSPVKATSASYQPGDVIPLYYNKLFSLKNPFAISVNSLDFICPLTQTRERSVLVFDQDLNGDRWIPSDYNIHFLKDQECRLLCEKSWQVEDTIKIEELIDNDYQVELELDGLPGATVSYTNEAPEHNYKIGYPLGFKKNDGYYINNHLVFQFLINTKNEIIGFEVYPDSILSTEDCIKRTVDYNHQKVTNRRTQVSFTYSVQWKKVIFDDGKIPTQRWQAYFRRSNLTRHTLAYTNGFFVTLILSILLVFVFLKTRNSSFLNSNSSDDKDKDLRVFEDGVDDFIGWKLISRDVFRRPVYGGILTPLVGSGIQLAVVFIGMLLWYHMGWFHPMQPRSFIRFFVLFYLIGSVPGGYYSARLYKVFRGKSWVLNGTLTAAMAPCVLFSTLILFSMLAWTQHSSLAISFGGWLSLFSLWLFVLFPLTLVGAYFGERSDPIEYPSRTTQLPRPLPELKWYQSDLIRTVLCGLIPFTVIFLQWHELLTLRFITGGDYSHVDDTHFFAMSLFYITTVSELSILFTFLKLCTENHLWWWSSFACGASSSLYLFSYGVFLIFTRSPFALTASSMTLSGCCLFLLRLFMECFLIAIGSGSCGFISSYLFIRKMYSTRKAD